MVIDPQALVIEMEKLSALGVSFDNNLMISESAHCILPFHKAIDLAREEAAGAAKIGTTGRGIGPAYEAKVSRYGVLIGDLLDEQVRSRETRCGAAIAQRVRIASFLARWSDSMRPKAEQREVDLQLRRRCLPAGALQISPG